MIKLEISSLKIPMYLGVYDFEKTLKREVIFNIILTLKTSSLFKKNDLDELLNYDKLILELIDNFQDKHFDLIEDLLYETNILLQKYKVIKSSEIKITKTGTHKEASGVSMSFFNNY